MKNFMTRRLAYFFLCLLTLAVAHAQTVRWNPPRGTLAVGQSTALTLVFEGCSAKGDPTLPKVDGLTLQFYGKSTSTSFINGSFSQTESLTFAAMVTKKQRIEIPSFQVETDKGKIRVAAATYEPVGATIGNSGTPLGSAASAKLEVGSTTVWTGEVVDLNVTVGAARSYAPQIQPVFDWTPEPFLAESWSKPEVVEFTSGSEPYVGYLYRARAVARTPGSFKLNPTNHIVRLSVGVTGFGFFQQRQYDEYSVTGTAPTIEVKALPPSPAGFSGAVGQFQLTSKVVPANAAVGEPITWTLELSGTGNWPDIAGLPSRDVSKDFNVVQPQAKRTPAEGKLFDVTLAEDVVLVPTKPGSYSLGPINFVYFDPKSGSYKTITTPRATVTIAAPAMPKIGLGESPATESGKENQTAVNSPGGVTLSSSPPPVSLAPSGIPRDPRTGSAAANIPLEPRALGMALLIPLGGFLVIWIGLAWNRAHQTDPLRPRRAARERLAATLAKLRTASPNARPALLLAWQRDAAALWEIPHAAPAAAAFSSSFIVGGMPPSRGSKERGEGSPSTSTSASTITAISTNPWPGLWNEADRALYGFDPALPADWITRAEAALAAKRVPGFSPARLFLPRNLAPFLFAFALIAVTCPVVLRAVEPATAYRAGDFVTAEKSWRETLEKTPVDWIARYNLSLALAQQDRWNESAAHATIAFVQSPADPAVRWHFALACDKAGFVPVPLAAFLQPGPAQLLAARASPGNWQRTIIAAAYGAAFALVVILLNAYGRRSGALGWSAFAVLVVCIAAAAAATIGVLSYGSAANTRAVISWRTGTLRSIPTDADTAQKTTPLAAGSVAIADKTFISDRWIHLTFENGQTGWVRKEELVWLWQ